MPVVSKSSAYGLRGAVGLLAKTNGFPDPRNVGNTWETLRVQRAMQSHFAGTDRTVEYDTTGSDPNAENPPIVIAPENTSGGDVLGVANNTALRMLDVEGVELRFTMQHPGQRWTTSFVHDVLQSMCDSIIPAANTVTGTVYADGTGVLTVDDATNLEVGMVVRATINAVAYDAQIVDIDGLNATLHPRLPAHDAAVTDYRLCVTYGPRKGQCPDAKLIQLDFVSIGLGHYAVDCVATKLRFEESDKRALELVVTMYPRGGVVFRHNNSESQSADAAVLTTTAMGRMQGCFHKTTVLVSPRVAPIALAYSDWDATDWAFEVTAEYEETAGCDNIIGLAVPSVTATKVSYTGKTRDIDAFTTAMRDGEHRTYVKSFGPPKRGGSLFLLGGFLKATETFESNDKNVTQLGFELAAGTWGGVDGAVADSLAATANWLFAVPKSNA